MPASRAALYTIKPTIGLVSQDGIIPICSLFDAAGPMTKSARDLALLLDVIVEADSQGKPKGGYISAATGSWEGLRIGSLDPSKWDFPADLRKPLDGAVEQIVRSRILSKTKTIDSSSSIKPQKTPTMSLRSMQKFIGNM